jgi:hypothetical protein
MAIAGRRLSVSGVNGAGQQAGFKTGPLLPALKSDFWMFKRFANVQTQTSAQCTKP